MFLLSNRPNKAMSSVVSPSRARYSASSASASKVAPLKLDMDSIHNKTGHWLQKLASFPGELASHARQILSWVSGSVEGDDPDVVKKEDVHHVKKRSANPATGNARSRKVLGGISKGGTSESTRIIELLGYDYNYNEPNPENMLRITVGNQSSCIVNMPKWYKYPAMAFATKNMLHDGAEGVMFAESTYRASSVDIRISLFNLTNILKKKHSENALIATTNIMIPIPPFPQDIKEAYSGYHQISAYNLPSMDVLMIGHSNGSYYESIDSVRVLVYSLVNASKQSIVQCIIDIHLYIIQIHDLNSKSTRYDIRVGKEQPRVETFVDPRDVYYEYHAMTSSGRVCKEIASSDAKFSLNQDGSVWLAVVNVCQHVQSAYEVLPYNDIVYYLNSDFFVNRNGSDGPWEVLRNERDKFGHYYRPYEYDMSVGLVRLDNPIKDRKVLVVMHTFNSQQLQANYFDFMNNVTVVTNISAPALADKDDRYIFLATEKIGSLDVVSSKVSDNSTNLLFQFDANGNLNITGPNPVSNDERGNGSVLLNITESSPVSSAERGNDDVSLGKKTIAIGICITIIVVLAAVVLMAYLKVYGVWPFSVMKKKSNESYQQQYDMQVQGVLYRNSNTVGYPQEVEIPLTANIGVVGSFNRDQGQVDDIARVNMPLAEILEQDKEEDGSSTPNIGVKGRLDVQTLSPVKTMKCECVEVHVHKLQNGASV